MRKFFAIRPPASDHARSFADADSIAAKIHPAVMSLDVRVVAVRPRTDVGFVYAITSRKNLGKDDVASRLRRAPDFREYQVSCEADAIDGPFVWRCQ